MHLFSSFSFDDGQTLGVCCLIRICDKNFKIFLHVVIHICLGFPT